MKNVFLIIFLVGVAAFAAEKSLTNADVVAMVKADLSESTILLAIQNSPNEFDRSPMALIGLKSAGVNARIMDAMVAARAIPQAPATSSSPALASVASEAEVQQILSGLASKQSEEAISLVSFRKTNGQSGVRDGVPLYSMDFEAIVKFNVDGIWREINITNDLSFKVARPQRAASGGGYWDQFLHVTQNPGVQCAEGSVFLIKGSARLEKTEQGWMLSALAHQGIERTNNAAVASMTASKGAINIPVNPPGANFGSGIKDLFDLNNLDQKPVARVQNPPQYPYEMSRAGISGEVAVEFIISSNGDVIDTRVIRSSHREFEVPAMQAVAKWKFKAGRKGDKNVNTRASQLIEFNLEDAK